MPWVADTIIATVATVLECIQYKERVGDSADLNNWGTNSLDFSERLCLKRGGCMGFGLGEERCGRRLGKMG